MDADALQQVVNSIANVPVFQRINLNTGKGYVMERNPEDNPFKQKVAQFKFDVEKILNREPEEEKDEQMGMPFELLPSEMIEENPVIDVKPVVVRSVAVMRSGRKRAAPAFRANVPGLEEIIANPGMRMKKAKSTQEFNAEMAAVAGMIVDPEDFPVVRMRDQYSVAPTATTSPKSNFKVSWNPVSNPPTQPLQLPINDWGGFVFRDPMRSSIRLITNDNPTVGAAFTYGALFNMETQSPSTLITKGQNKDLEPTIMQVVGNNKPHGPYLPCGQGEGRVGVWIDADATNQASVNIAFTIVPAETPAALPATVNIYRWSGGTWIELPPVTATSPAGSGAWNIPVALAQSGYYAFSVDFAKLTTDYSATLAFTSHTTQVWAHAPMGDIFPYNVQQINGIRTLAVGALLKNEASPLNQQGNLIMLQASKDEDWYETYASQVSGFYDFCFDTASEKDFLLRNGGYAYLKPTSEEDLAFNDDIKHGAPGTGYGTIASLWFQLHNQSDYLIFAASCDTQGGGDCVWKIKWAVEYKTQNNWIERTPPVVAPQAFSDGIEAVSGMQQFFENPIHWKNIFKTIGKVAQVGAPILAQLGPYGQAGSSVLNAIGGITQAL